MNDEQDKDYIDIESQSALASTNKVDQNKVDSEAVRAAAATKIDVRNFVDHTFTGTSEETFDNTLGRTPRTIHIAGQDRAAQIFVNVFSSTKTKLFATSTVAGAKVRFVLA